MKNCKIVFYDWQKRVHPRSPGNINPVIYRIVLDELTGKFEKE